MELAIATNNKEGSMAFFEFDATTELFWIYSASSLWTSANVLLEKEKKRKRPSLIREPYLLGVSIMLVGFAIENLIKGVIAKEEGILNKKKDIKKEVATHKLIKLFKQIKFPLNSHEEQVVEILEKYVIWVGRYPIPKGGNEMLLSGLISGGRKQIKSKKGYWMIDKTSEFKIEPDIFNICSVLLNKLKQRILPGQAFDLFNENQQHRHRPNRIENIDKPY